MAAPAGCGSIIVQGAGPVGFTVSTYLVNTPSDGLGQVLNDITFG